ncbi:MAG: hypothetical protein JWN45_3522 [Acidobacteriaceae bacterium]|nr:hypothetical protein [Acidobacteriaceae bacterium]
MDFRRRKIFGGPFSSTGRKLPFRKAISLDLLGRGIAASLCYGKKTGYPASTDFLVGQNPSQIECCEVDYTTVLNPNIYSKTTQQKTSSCRLSRG